MTGLKRITSPYSFSFAVEAGDFVFLSGHRGFGKGFTTQLENAFSHLGKTLAGLNIPLANLVRINVKLRNIKDVPEMEQRVRNYFRKDEYPVRVGGSTEFVDDDSLFGVDGIACRKEATMADLKRITTPFSYSLAVQAGDYVFLGIHKGSGDTFTEQFHDAFKHLKQTLAEFDLTLADIVKVNVWLKNIEDVRVYEKLFNDYFEKDKFPARMGATTEFIDDDCLLMIEGVAYRGNK